MNYRNLVKSIVIDKPKWRVYKRGEAYVCRVILSPEEEGGFCAACLNLPEVVSQGATSGEALAKVIESFRQTVLRYQAANQPVPWVRWHEVEAPTLPGAREIHPTVLL